MRAPFHVLKFKNTFYGSFRATEIVNEAWKATLAVAQVLKAKTNLLVLLRYCYRPYSKCSAYCRNIHIKEGWSPHHRALCESWR